MPRIKIGTRGSLLAVTQANMTLDKLTALTGQKFELVTIKTEGDLKTEKPLWQMDGKDFFTKELDHALREGEVDAIIHSYKDLGSDRPAEFKLAAVTKRENPHDILILRPGVKEQLIGKEKSEVIIGTSSPRRIENLKKDLSQFLPFHPAVTTKNLRGNVNTRIEKMLNGEYDGIVLAFAGLERLASREESRKVLVELIDKTDLMILPLTKFPTAAAQGALAIECLETNEKIVDLLETVHDEETFRDTQIERETFRSFGGGCHLAVGISVLELDDKAKLEIRRGEHNETRIEKEVYHQKIDRPKTKNTPLFIGLHPDKLKGSEDLIGDLSIEREFLPPCTKNRDQDHQKALFVTSQYCLSYFDRPAPSLFTWAAGSSTAKKLTEKGVWVDGVSDCRGSADIGKWTQTELFKCYHKTKNLNWKILTHNQANHEWGEVVACYDHQFDPSLINPRVQEVEWFFWTSFVQFKLYSKTFPAILGKNHACGPGKTKELFNQHEIPVTVFPGWKVFVETTKGVPSE